MLISGLEKMTLLDHPGKLSAVVFTYGCNMLCPYCHNPELVTAKFNKYSCYRDDEVITFLKRRVGKLDSVTITGGEPTIQRDLIEFIQRVKELGFEVKLDTNGSLPLRVKEIMDLGLVDYWAMDIKYSEELYEQGLNGGMMIKGVGESIGLIMDSGVEYEFRTTFMRGLHDEISVHEIGEMIKGAKKYYIQNFRAGKTIDESLGKGESFKEDELERFAEIMRGYVGEVIVR
jgi:pyruvate formate lyase activating enzyme